MHTHAARAAAKQLNNFSHLWRASTKSHASGKSKNPYFRYNLKMEPDVFFDALIPNLTS